MIRCIEGTRGSRPKKRERFLFPSKPKRQPSIIEGPIEAEGRNLVVGEDAEVVIPRGCGITLIVLVRVHVENVVHACRKGEPPGEGVGRIDIGDPLGPERLIERAIGWGTEAGDLAEPLGPQREPKILMVEYPAEVQVVPGLTHLDAGALHS